MYTNWTELETACKACEKCELCQTRTHVVFGMGNPQSDILFIGEGPGENEDLEGLPFVGRSGQLLDKMLAAIMTFIFFVVVYVYCKYCKMPSSKKS